MCSKSGQDLHPAPDVQSQLESSAVHEHGHSHVHEHHHHHHGHGVPASAAAMNAEYYDREAANYENLPGARELLRDIAIKMREIATFDPSSTRVLDFACGIGLSGEATEGSSVLTRGLRIGMLSRELAPYTKSIVGVDISPVSVAIYNHKAEGLRVADKMRATALDLLHTSGELRNESFDVVVVSIA